MNKRVAAFKREYLTTENIIIVCGVVIAVTWLLEVL